MIRQPYPAGPPAKLTNDPNDYVGVSLSGDRLLYTSVIGGKPAILRVTPVENTPEDVVLEGLAPAATSDGRTIVFVSSTTDDMMDLWTADASGRRKTRLVASVVPGPVAVTPDDRFVLFTSIAGGTVSIWIVAIEGGSPTKLADGVGGAVSPDGGSIAFTAMLKGVPSLLVCSLPTCSSPRPIGTVKFVETTVSWSPDGRGVAYAVEGNLWVQPLSGGAPRQLTRFTDGRPIAAFQWSRDGQRLALTRPTVTNDIVLFESLN